MDFIEDIKKVGLDPDLYEECMRDIQDKVDGVIDLDWEEIKEKYHLTVTSDCLRKAAGSKPFGGIFVRSYFKDKYDISNLPTSYIEQMADLRKEKQKLFDERAALNKINRENSRIEQDLDYLEKLIKNTSYSSIAVKNVEHGDNDLLISISDVHLGLDVNNGFGAYNSDIAYDRMVDYLSEVLKIKSVHHSEKAYVALLGDLLSGSIHQTLMLENRENVVEQIQKVSEMISGFIYELSKNFEEVYVNGVAGNHSRLNAKKDQILRDERLDDLVLWYLKAKLDNLDNVYFVDDQNYDATIAKLYIRQQEFIVVHGDYDHFSESGVSKLVMMLGHKPTGILCGHLHRCSMDEVAGIKIMRSGCFSGTVDDYTISKRISGRPSQLVCVIDKDGVRALYPVELK